MYVHIFAPWTLFRWSFTLVHVAQNDVTTGVLISPYPDPTEKKKQLKGCRFSTDAEDITAAKTWLSGQPSELFFEWLAKVRVWSLYPVAFLVGLRTYSTPVLCVCVLL